LNDGDETYKPATRQELIEVFQDFDERLLDLFNMVDESTLKRWKLMDMDSVDDWVKDRFCIIGDAAHPFLPHQGQGGAQAIEDGACLGVVLPLGTLPEEINSRLRLYQECRKERAEIVQDVTRKSGADVGPGTADHVSKVMQFFLYNCGHDEIHHSTQRLREWNYKTYPERYHPQSVVASFGPTPRLTRNATASRCTTRTVTFRTSRTQLQTLLPSRTWSFTLPDTIAIASYAQTSFENVPALGGKAYNSLAFYLHGVQYTKKDGTGVKGKYLAVIFEDSADMVVLGREEQGLPKMFADIGVQNKDEASVNVAASWRGTTFLNLELDNLKDSQGREAGVDDEELILTHKASRDENFSIVSSPNPTANGVKKDTQASAEAAASFRKAAGTECRLAVDAHSQQALPTLYHVVSRLTELPVYEMLEGSIVSGLQAST
jgi:hypothetical protein